MFRKVAMVGAAVLMVMTVVQPAMAGLGGCRGNACGNKNSVPVATEISIVDAMSSIFPAHVVAVLKALTDTNKEDNVVVQEPSDIFTDGLGGCRLTGCSCGLGGC